MHEHDLISPPREFWFLGARLLLRLSRADNADGLTVIEHRMPHGFAPPLHLHRDEAETFHVLEGEFRFRLDGRDSLARAGDTVHLPAGVAHGFRVLSPGGGCFLTISRGGFEAMVVEVATPAPAGTAMPNPSPPTPAQQAALAAACARHGIDLLGPPID